MTKVTDMKVITLTADDLVNLLQLNGDVPDSDRSKAWQITQIDHHDSYTFTVEIEEEAP